MHKEIEQDGNRGEDRREFLRRSAILGAALGLSGGLPHAFAARPAHNEEGKANKKSGKTLLILGGTAFLGPELVEAAQAKGWTITLFNRGKTNPHLFPDLEKLHGDRNGDLKSLEGRKWDAVIDTSGYVPRHVHDSAALLANATKQYVFISTISVYDESLKPGGDETATLGKIENEKEEKVTGASYGPLKALCEQAAEKAMPGRVTVIRPGLIVGPGDPTDRFSYWPVRLDRGGEAIAPGKPSDPVQVIDVRDLAEWTIRMVEAGHMGIYNAVGPKEKLGVGAMLEACRKASATPATLVWIDSKFLEEQKVSPWGDMPVWIPPEGEGSGMSQVSIARALGKGLTFRNIETTAKDTLAWWKEQPEKRRSKLRAGISPEREQEVLAAFKAKTAKG